MAGRAGGAARGGQRRGQAGPATAAPGAAGPARPAEEPPAAVRPTGGGAPEEEGLRVYLKSLTLRGFKSFASATTLRFEQGITCVVGPNGSGKSNVVDAFSWVMGEQGVKPLRGGKMEDVVFAGTAGRPPLGRAEVTLTIDNSDGALPIEYAEVTISRLLFRSGQSEYSINGDHCRLLDVQELLSDTGLGREMHVIVGQGHLDDVLNAGPDARRALIEEAAGVLKHRRRKEKALRKLEAMQANLTRLVDLTAEIGRRLKPLGRQAEIARKAAMIQADLRDARLRLLADDYATLAAELERDETDEAAIATRRAALEARLDQARAAEAALEAAEQQHAPRLAAAQEAFFGLSSLSERMRGVLSLASERHRHLSAPPEPLRPGRDPDELDAEAARLREQEAALRERLTAARDQLGTVVARRTAAETALAETERRLAADARAAAARAERLARLRSQVGSARSRLAAGQEEAGRLTEAYEQARSRAEHAQHEYGELQDVVADREQGRADLAARHERATAALERAAERVARLRSAEHEASDARAALRARTEALAEAVRSGADASGALLAEPGRFAGVLGSVADLLTVQDGAADAITAALGAAAGAVAVSGLDAAVNILTALRMQDAGQAALMIAADRPQGEHPADGGPQRELPAAARPLASRSERTRAPASVMYALDLVKAPGELAAAVEHLLDGVLVAADLRQGQELVRADPRLRVVTWDGDLIGAHWARGGSAGAPTLLGLRAAAQEAAGRLEEAELRCQRAERELADAAEDEDAARQALAEALAELQEADADAAETSGRLGTLAGAARAAQDEARRLEAAIATAERAREKDLAQLAELRGRLAVQEAEGPAGPGRGAGGEAVAAAAGDGEPATDGAAGDKNALAAEATAARNAEMEARLEVRTVEERLRAVAGRGDALASAAAAERQAVQRAKARSVRRAQEAAVADSVASGATIALAAIERSRAMADADRQAAEQASRTRDGELKDVRARIRELAAELDTAVSSAHGAEIERATRRMKLEQVAARAAEEFAVDADTLVAEYGPDVDVPGSDEGQMPAGYDRAAQERRAQTAQRLLDQLGKVNPLALEEFSALEERHAFLSTQLEDLKKTRRDLLTVIKEVDDRVQQVFASAYEDTAREFEDIIGRLFPGGEGRLVLTEPDDLLVTGIEIEARPPGKKVKRLSLLSGGERALTAIAFVVAIFRARPSPFYVLDEVEAALDDTNLQRLLEIFTELRDTSQLIVVTHQQRTMEVADTLYGITMRGDGVSSVVSQRLREPESAS
jgi:chromosome segregation protein